MTLSQFRIVSEPGCVTVGEERVLIWERDGLAHGDSGRDEADQEHAKEAH